MSEGGPLTVCLVTPPPCIGSCRLRSGASKSACAAQELAARLLRKRHAKRDWAASYEAFWASVPPVGSVYAKENWRAEHVAALQDQKLVPSSSKRDVQA